MSQIVVDGLDDESLQRLRERAEENGRSLEDEVRVILEAASEYVSMATARRMAAELRLETRGLIHGNSADLIREDRDSR